VSVFGGVCQFRGGLPLFEKPEMPFDMRITSFYQVWKKVVKKVVMVFPSKNQC